MTVDMLAAAFIWPEEMLIGRTPIGNELDPRASDEIEIEKGSAPEAEAMPFWAAWVRRFRANPPATGAEAR